MVVKTRKKKTPKVIPEVIAPVGTATAVTPLAPPIKPFDDFDDFNEPEAPKKEVAKSPEPVKAPFPIDYTSLVIKQPGKINGKLLKQDAATLQLCLYWKHLDHGGAPTIDYLVPGVNQRPHPYQDKCKWWGLYHFINNNRIPMYFMQEVKLSDGTYLPAPYEPDILSSFDVTPFRHYRDTDWSRWRAYLLHHASGWQDVIKTGLIIIGIIVVIIFSWMSWNSNAKRGQIPVANTTAISAPVPKVVK